MLYFFDRVVNIFYHPQKILKPLNCLLSLSLLPPLSPCQCNSISHMKTLIEHRNTSLTLNILLLIPQRPLQGLYQHHPKLLNYISLLPAEIHHIHVHTLIHSNRQVMLNSLIFYLQVSHSLRPRQHTLLSNRLLFIFISGLILDFEPVIFWNLLLYLLFALAS